RIGDPGFGVREYLLRLGFAAGGPADGEQRLLPWRRPGIALIAEGRGDLAENGVLLLGQAREGGDDEVRRQGGDLLEGRFARRIEQRWRLRPHRFQRLLDPGLDA